jgi:ATP-dependent exoDNAse (exonuclease V) beta subunit
MAACDETLQDLYDQERMKEMVNRLNSLYVGFTRPERELYVVGVKSRDAAYPFVLLPSEEFPPSAATRKAREKTSVASVAPTSCPFHRRRLLEFPSSSEEFCDEEKRVSSTSAVYIDFVRAAMDEKVS